MKRIITVLFFIFSLLNLSAENIIITKKAAKVSNEVILVREVENYSKLYKIDYEKAKEYLIEEAILFIGAKLYTEEPKETDISNQIRDDKAFYASKVGKDLKNITDEEFLSALLTNNVSMRTYKEYEKKKLWISKFISESYEKEKIKRYYPTTEELEQIMKNKPELFEEKESVILSMIYFSYYGSSGSKKNDEQIKLLKNKAEECLKTINEDNFVEMVNKYSDDLISLHSTPKGRVGKVPLDDPRTLNSFSEEIISVFKTSNIGLIPKVFETQNGLYIFRIEARVQAIKLSKEESILKAESYLQKEYEQNLKGAIRQRLVNELKRQMEIIIY